MDGNKGGVDNGAQVGDKFGALPRSENKRTGAKAVATGPKVVVVSVVRVVEMEGNLPTRPRRVAQHIVV